MNTEAGAAPDATADNNNKNWNTAAGYAGASVTLRKVNKMTCTLVISTYTNDSSSAVEWFDLAAALDVDGGTTSNWVEYETFVKMIAATPDLKNTVGTATGSNYWTEAQGKSDGTVYHSPVVNLVFG
jgi:hypothetical protein